MGINNLIAILESKMSNCSIEKKIMLIRLYLFITSFPLLLIIALEHLNIMHFNVVIKNLITIVIVVIVYVLLRLLKKLSLNK